MGMPAEIRHIVDMCSASKARVFLKSALGIDVCCTEEGLAFNNWQDNSECSVSFWKWHCNAFMSNICRNRMQLRMANIWDKIEVNTTAQDRKSIQKRAYLLIRNLSYSSGALFNFVRSRLAYWKLDIPLGLLANRCQNRCQDINGSCKPSVFSAVLRTWLNG